MKVGDKVRFKKWDEGSLTYYGTMDEYLHLDGVVENVAYNFVDIRYSDGVMWRINTKNVYIVEEQKDEHYNNDNGSLYLFAQNHELNAWEFDILKRVVRCRKKGQFIEDLEKTKRVIDLYLKEFNNVNKK